MGCNGNTNTQVLRVPALLPEPSSKNRTQELWTGTFLVKKGHKLPDAVGHTSQHMETDVNFLIKGKDRGRQKHVYLYVYEPNSLC